MILGRDRRRQNMKRLALGSTLAAAAGFVVGLLTAPKSGKETRRDIKLAADKSLAEIEKDAKKLSSELDQAIKQSKSQGSKASARTKKQLSELVDKADASQQKVREVINALRQGDAKDKDLKKAVKEASTALNHLKAYLKK